MILINKVENGYIIREDTDTGSVSTVHEVSEEVDGKINMIHHLIELFEWHNNKWADGPVNINIYAGPGRKSETENHVKAWLEHFWWRPSDGLVQRVTEAIHAEDDQ